MSQGRSDELQRRQTFVPAAIEMAAPAMTDTIRAVLVCLSDIVP